ncbi:tyrosine-type recombinase/integrase [Siccirubricoccus deserti]|uniref:Tyrosine-type recombinase/integrase n=1 Tax=Siccirubricoccus deserti TaxID=2013562 RepID=A0A9X0R4L8_9PROT|nr:tyrosine-type recombinase/integrase [Siccirubricoccus deserti]MBC4018287.1 tyrosine-type recombinase/integrase [Siccirubricoccus deserti]
MAFERDCAAKALAEPQAGTVGAAIRAYRQSADFMSRSPNSRRHYDYHLRLFAADFGHLAMRSITYGWVDEHRDKWFAAGRLNTWNEIRKVMRAVTDRFINHNPLVIPFNPWQRVRRLGVDVAEEERQNRPWPAEVIIEVFRHATPAFRALLTVYIYTGQRGGNVVRFGNAETTYNPTERCLIFSQEKTGKRMRLPVPEALHVLLVRQDGTTALLTPQGRPWNTLNAQEALRTLLRNLGLPRYTLHGLRSTVAATLAEAGFGEMVLMAQGGWESSRTVRGYLRGHEQQKVLAGASDALAARFEPLIRQAKIDGNERRFSGVTGRAAARAGVEGRARERAKNRLTVLDPAVDPGPIAPDRTDPG